MNRQSNPTPDGSRRTGFTLVELLTVIGIIGLLVAILVPAVNQVRIAAKNSATESLIGTLSTGLETFRADQQVGGKYPPSASDDLNGGKLSYAVRRPYTTLGGRGDRIRGMTGAGLLVWALVGADQLGTPGFRSFAPDRQFWANSTGADKVDGDYWEAYALDDNREPRHSRVGPFVDTSKVELSRWDQNLESFVLPVEQKTRKALGEGDSDQPAREYPMFLDSFGGPVLYWRADPAGIRLADESPNFNDKPQDRGIYHYYDNGPLLDWNVAGNFNTKPMWLTVDRNPFSNDDPHDLLLKGDVDPDPSKLQIDQDRKMTFPRAIQDLDVTAKSMPVNAKSYILLSAGRDGVFGTSDDIGNFKVKAK